ncbi:MAG: glycosyltransferase family 4 protein [Candidatus Bathyarchaeia archaeon]|jgi:glycosyltransferase involved in cell wall biosynthesis
MIMKALNICRVTHALYPDVVGGHAIYCHELSSRQSRLGHEIEVVTVRRDKLPRRERSKTGYEISRYENVWMPWDALGMANPFALPIYGAVRVSKCDLVDAHSPLFWTTVLSVKAALDSAKPAITTVHGVMALRDWLTNTSQLIYLKSVGTWLLRNSTRVICLTRADAREVRDLGVPVRNIRIVPVGVDTALFRPGKGKRKGIAWVGRIVPEKGLDVLLEALAKVRKRIHVHTIIAGDGPLRGKLIRRAHELKLSDSVTFVRQKNRRDVARMLAQSLVYVLPSRREGLPLALLEAMAAGNTVVASDLPSTREVLGEAGLYYSCKDPDELAERLLMALEDRKLCRRFGREVRDTVHRRFRWESVLPALSEVYGEAVKSS